MMLRTHITEWWATKRLSSFPRLVTLSSTPMLNDDRA